jgi:hypothetical protein
MPPPPILACRGSWRQSESRGIALPPARTRNRNKGGWLAQTEPEGRQRSVSAPSCLGVLSLNLAIAMNRPERDNARTTLEKP